MAKLLVALMREKPAPGRDPLMDMTLEKRISYAINCLQAGDTGEAHEAQAREFLTKAREHLDASAPEHKALLNQIDEVL